MPFAPAVELLYRLIPRAHWPSFRETSVLARNHTCDLEKKRQKRSNTQTRLRSIHFFSGDNI
ncbi:MAG: hypothetical protein DMG96_17095 [Acidobacteria bacterium]|nr:MAG: hypothetical protein DMG96_17095 [Acidobacteriota bacterium]